MRSVRGANGSGWWCNGVGAGVSIGGLKDNSCRVEDVRDTGETWELKMERYTHQR